jgi:hypothetical protein
VARRWFEVWATTRIAKTTRTTATDEQPHHVSEQEA